MQSNGEVADLASLSADKPDTEMPESTVAPIDDSSPAPTPPPAASTDDAVAEPAAEESGPETTAQNDTGASSPIQITTDEVTAGEVGPWVDVTSDGKVKKRTFKSGSGQVPELHSVCLGTY